MALWLRKFTGRFGTRKIRPYSVMNQASTIDKNDIDFYNKMADKWWDETGDMKALHALNKLRISFIRDGLINTGIIVPEKRNDAEPLKGLSFLDVGCGGGILSEPLARLGAQVTGLDASPQMISTARAHAAKDHQLSSRLSYIYGTVEEHVNVHVGIYDAVVASEILEHVQEQQLLVESCAKSLKPGGSMFITAINRTILSWLGAIVAAEKVLRLVPNGTHSWDKFICPEEVEAMLNFSGCDTKMVHGIMYNFLTNNWNWIPSTHINYAVHAVKRKSSEVFN